MPRAKTVTPTELKVGDFFSYPGSFKIYRVETKPEICPHFKEPTTGYSIGPKKKALRARFRFRVSSNGYNKELGIRLRADIQCTLHDGFDVPILKQLACIADKGHFENWGDGKFRFYFSGEEVQKGEDGFFSDDIDFYNGEESPSIETVIRRSYEKYQRNLQRYRNDS